MKKNVTIYSLLIPLVFAIILVVTGRPDVNIGTLIRQGLFEITQKIN